MFVVLHQNSTSEGRCGVVQESGRDYKEPMFRVFLDAGDDLSYINMTLDIGTVPGGKDVIAGKELGGFSTMLNDVSLLNDVSHSFNGKAVESGFRKFVRCHNSLKLFVEFKMHVC
jgi:hypothetical protein